MIERLFVYGTLAPGRPNEHVLHDVPGTWKPAAVSGRLLEQGWGSQLGYPGMILDENGPEIHGVVLTSEDLSTQWERLDEFEGEGYERVLITVQLDEEGTVEAQIYVLREQRAIAES